MIENRAGKLQHVLISELIFAVVVEVADKLDITGLVATLIIDPIKRRAERPMALARREIERQSSFSASPFLALCQVRDIFFGDLEMDAPFAGTLS